MNRVCRCQHREIDIPGLRRLYRCRWPAQLDRRVDHL